MKLRRRHPRVRPLSSKPVEVQIMGAGFLEVLNATDISIGGVGIVVPHGFEATNLDNEVDLIITLPMHGSISAKGQIRHQYELKGSNIYGVQFLSMPQSAVDKLQEYIGHMTKLGCVA